MLSAIVDLSKRKRQADALERSNIDLQRFAYIASHDLQTPLRSIAGFVDRLGSTYADSLDAQAEGDSSYRSSEGVALSAVPVDDLQSPHPAELAQVARHQGCVA